MKPDIDPAEMVRRELANQFYLTLKTKHDGGRVTIDFNAFPRQWQIQMPTMFGIPKEADPPVVNVLDIIRDAMPGIWGYAEAAGCAKEEVCTRCQKIFSCKK